MLVLAAAFGGCGGLPGSETGDTGSDSGAPAADPAPPAWIALEDEVLRLVNVARHVGATCGNDPMAGGLAPLESDPVLRRVARAHSRDMSVRGFFAHDSPDGEDPFDRMAEAGFAGALPWGENIAAGQPTAQSVFDGWMGSPPHCTNIMTRQFGVIGIGYFDGVDAPYWTQNFAGTH